jgi:hypothetical protein
MRSVSIWIKGGFFGLLRILFMDDCLWLGGGMGEGISLSGGLRRCRSVTVEFIRSIDSLWHSLHEDLGITNLISIYLSRPPRTWIALSVDFSWQA